jgi:hypothetical protein
VFRNPSLARRPHQPVRNNIKESAKATINRNPFEDLKATLDRVNTTVCIGPNLELDFEGANGEVAISLGNEGYSISSGNYGTKVTRRVVGVSISRRGEA